ncbi:hypothetical protein [Rhizobium sp. BK176]|uniref:hypothetical protein n=1 Tax=Rhizobium sp. BK176 TaxID=2587071 RepID=UPI002169D751|nr:hypothetical protein [Rhizobium sp. BK176]MCS4090027.1 hypothetical protein [Rhizobium sp. BK176]
MIDYAKLRQFNARLGDAPRFLGLPVVPSVEMMLAAANRSGVYRPGDRLADYIVAWDFEPDDKPPVLPTALEEAHGRQMAFVLCVLADAWAGCMKGFREWTERRGREGATPFVASWLRALPTACPEGGWPETKEAATAAHETHAKSADTRTVPQDGFGWWELDRNATWPGPSLCLGIMALRARQRETTTLLFGSFEELVDHAKLPYVPGYTKDHYFDDEERSAMLVSAMWDAAVQELLESETHTPFPVEDQAHAALLVEELSHGRRYRENWSSFYSDAPFREASVTTAQARFHAAVGPNGIDWEGEDMETGTTIGRKGADLRYPHEAALLRTMVDLLDRHEGTGHTSVPLA